MVGIISALVFFRAGNFALVTDDKVEHFYRFFVYVRRNVVVGENEVKSRSATHRSEIYRFVPKHVVTPKGGAEMFYGVNGVCRHYAFPIRQGKAHIEGG